MKKLIVPVIEGIALLVCILLAILWIQDPGGAYEPFIVAISFVFVVVDFVKRCRSVFSKKKHSKLDIDYENTLVTTYINPNKPSKKSMCIMFYGVTIVNNSEVAYTVKQVLLEYSFHQRTYTLDSHVIPTGLIYSPRSKKDEECVIVHKGEDNIILMNWCNLRTAISEHNVISPGGTLNGSLVYILEQKTPENVAEIVNAKLLVSDYSDNEKRHLISIPQDSIEKGKKTYISPREFSHDKDRGIVYTD